MIEIVGVPLTQWDVKRQVKVTGDAEYVHFANPGDSKAVKLPLNNGMSEIPEYLLQTGKALNVYAVLDGVTLESRSFAVRKRERPADYIYEPNQRDYIYTLIDEANKAIKNANDAAEELREAIKNGDIVIPEGGGANVLIVHADGDIVDHSSRDIFDHVEKGGTVMLFYNWRYYSLLSVAQADYAWFGYIDDGGTAQIVCVNDYEAEGFEQNYATETGIAEAIKENMMVVQVPNGHQADHLPSQILAHLREGGAVMLEVDGYFVNLSYCIESYATFAEMNDDLYHFVHTIDADGNYACTETQHASQEVVDAEIGNISTALDRIIEIQEELIGT